MFLKKINIQRDKFLEKKCDSYSIWTWAFKIELNILQKNNRIKYGRG